MNHCNILILLFFNEDIFENNEIMQKRIKKNPIFTIKKDI